MPACGYSLASIIMELAVRAGMDPRTINVSRLAADVSGFQVTSLYPVSEALRALSQIFFFDPSNHDGRVHFMPRGQNTVATITQADMLEDDEDIQQSRRGDPFAVPRVMNLNYYDVRGGLSTDKQTSERSGDRRATGEMQLATAVVMNADQARQVVTINHKVLIEDTRGDLTFRLPDNFLYLVDADCVFVVWENRVERVRIAKSEVFDGYQRYTMIRDRQTAYTSNAEGFPAASQGLPASNVAGPTLLELLDIPLLRDTQDGLGLFYFVAITGASDAWRGATVELSYDGGANFVDARDLTDPIIMGELTTALADHPADYPDTAHTCRVTIATPGGELEDATLAEMLSRKNLAIIGDELVNFGGADEISPGLWELSFFLRGRKDTGTTSHPIGTRFVMLDELTAVPAAVTDLGRDLTFRATSFGATVDTGTTKTMHFTGRSQTERRVGYLAARRDGVDALVTWQGVARLGGGGTVAHGARFAGYRVTFDDGSGPPLVVDTMNQALTQDVSSFSAPLTISVAQLNDLTGAGPAVEVVLE